LVIWRDTALYISQAGKAPYRHSGALREARHSGTVPCVTDRLESVVL